MILLVLACDPAATVDAGQIGDSAVNRDTGPEIVGGTESEPDDSDTAEDEDPGPSAEDDAAWEAFYDVSVVQQIVIEIDQATIDDMNAQAADPDADAQYVHANLTLNDERLDDVGLRLRGGSNGQDWSQKPSLKVKFNEWDDDLRYAGLKRATLDSMTGDPAMAREVIAWHLWRAAGMAVPRASFAQLWVSIDGAEPEYFGLYANVEAMDGAWVERNYPDDGGDLWEGKDSAEFSQAGMSHFELVTGDGDKEALDRARDAVQNHGSDFYAAADEQIDMDQFLDFWALSIAVGNRDGYPFHLDHFYVYGDPEEGRFNFSPWGMEQSWDTATPTYWRYLVGDVAEQCLYYDATCPERYLSAQAEALVFYESEDLPSFAQACFDLTEAAMIDDMRKNQGGETWTTSEVESARDLLMYRVQMYPEWLRANIGL